MRTLKCLGLRLAADRVQVSCNVTDVDAVPLYRVTELVRRAAARRGVAVLRSELIGLAPLRALERTARAYEAAEGSRNRRTFPGCSFAVPPLAVALAVLALLCAPLQPPAADAATANAPAPQTRTLANGLKVVVIEDHAAPVAQVHMWYRFGALDETPGKTGLAHALEHMMFRGTHDLSSAGLDDMTARLGGEVNAQTENEMTHFYFVVPADRVDTIVHLEADRMRGLKLDPGRLEPRARRGARRVRARSTATRSARSSST